MDEISETDHLFATRTVDEVAGYCRETQSYIAKTQEELRSLIGQKYRELLNCCDLVVGMDDVCEQIQRRNLSLKTATAPSNHHHATGATRNAGSKGHATMASAGTTAHDLSLATPADVHRQAYSALLLLREGNFRRAVLSYKAAVAQIGDTSNLVMAPPLLQTAARVAELVPAALRQALQRSVAALAAVPASNSVTDQYDDIHGALSDLNGQSRAEVVEDVVSLHMAAIDELVASNDESVKSLGAKVGLLAMRCLAYVAHHASNSVAIAPSLQPAASLDQLLALDPQSEGFEDKLRREVCQFGALTGAADRSTAFNGWMSPLPLQQPALDVTATLNRIFAALDACFTRLCTAAGSAKRIGAAEAAFLESCKSLSWSLPDASLPQRLQDTATRIFAASLVELCTKKLATLEQEALQSIKDATAAPPTTGAAASQPDAAAQPQSSNKGLASKSGTPRSDLTATLMRQVVAKTSALLHVKAASLNAAEGKRKPVAAAAPRDFAQVCLDTMADVKALCATGEPTAASHHPSDLMNTYRKQLEERLLQAVKAISDACRRAMVATRTNSALSDDAKASAALRIANVASAALVDPLASSGIQNAALKQALADAQRVVLELHEPWANTTIQAVTSNIRTSLQDLVCSDDAQFERRLRWNISERAEYPTRPSEWVVTALLDLRRIGGQQYVAACGRELAQRELAWLGEQLALHVEKVALDVLRRGADSSLNAAAGRNNYALIQLWFDVWCVTAALYASTAEHTAATLRRELDARVDPVILAFAEPALPAAVTELTLSTCLGLGIVLPPSRRSGGGDAASSSMTSSGAVPPTRPKAEAKRMPQARDGQRITNVPLPTAPKPVNRAAVPSASSAGGHHSGAALGSTGGGDKAGNAGGSGAAATGTALLRGLMSGWTS